MRLIPTIRWAVLACRPTHVRHVLRALLVTAVIAIPGIALQAQTLPPIPPLHEKAFRHMTDGMFYEQQGNYAAAILEYHDALRYDSTATTLYYALFENYLRLQKPDNALEALRQYVRYTPDDQRAGDFLIGLLRENNQLAEAEQTISRLLRTRQDTQSLRFQLLLVHLQQGDIPKAERQGRLLITEGKPDDPPFTDLASAYTQYHQMRAGIALLDDYAAQYADNPGHRYALGQLHFGLADTTVAIAYFERTYQIDPEFNDIRDLVFDLYVAQRRFDEAEALLDQLEVPRRLELGRQYLIGGTEEDSLRASRLFSKILNDPPRTWSKYFAVGRLYLDVNRYEEALRYLKAAIAIDSTEIEQYYFLSFAYAQLEQLAIAETYASKLLAKHPEEKRFQNWLGSLYLDQDKADDAIALWGREVAAGTADAHQHYLLGLALNIANQPDDAAASIITAMKMEPGRKSYQNALSRIYLRKEDYALAIRLLSQWLIEDPQDTDKRFLLSLAYFRNQDFYQAIGNVDGVLEDDPEHVDALSLQGDAFFALGDWEKAEKSFLRVISIQPDNDLVLNNYSYMLAERGEKLENALAMSLRAVKAQPDNTSYLDTLGWIYHKLQRNDEALEYVRKSVALDGANAVVLEHLGDVYKELSDWENARRYWQQALEQDPESQIIKQKLSQSNP